MAATAEKTDPALWERIKAEVTADEKGGHAGQWSARKAQMAVQAYKKAGGGYRGKKAPDNHLAEWTHEEWGTKTGRPSGETGERYLPHAALDAISDDDYRRTTAKKRADTRRGKQFSAQPSDVAAKTADVRHGHDGLAGKSKAELLGAARQAGIAGRSGMTKDELAAALSRRA